jgi:hypothetical protein
MTVKEMFENKYRERMATITEREWKRANQNAEHYQMHVAEYIVRCIEVSEKEFNANGIYYQGGELEELHKQKLIASNRHRQEHGHVTVYWLTPKGYKKLFN